MSALDRIREQVTGNNVVLYMKGTPQFPQCGFSSKAAQVLQACGVNDFLAVNVLADPEIFENLKHYANWPTFPQLYVKGELIGGSDIIRVRFNRC
jgi:monothiol glutaredoxin